MERLQRSQNKIINSISMRQSQLPTFQLGEIFVGHRLHARHVIESPQSGIDETPKDICDPFRERHVIIECEHTVRNESPRRHQAHRMIEIVGMAERRNRHDRCIEFVGKRQPTVVEKLLQDDHVEPLIRVVDEMATFRSLNACSVLRNPTSHVRNKLFHTLSNFMPKKSDAGSAAEQDKE